MSRTSAKARGLTEVSPLAISMVISGSGGWGQGGIKVIGAASGRSALGFKHPDEGLHQIGVELAA